LDFWDLTKLLYRRWYLTLPMLLLTGAASVWTLVGVKPNYIATTYIQLVGPVIQPTEPGQQSADQRNPWLQQGLNALANAAVVTVQDYSVIQALHGAGYSDTFKAELNSGAPLVTFEITGSSPAQATATANEIVARFQRSVADLQTASGARPSDLVTAKRLDLGTNIQESNARVKRAVVAVGGVGLLLTIGLTVGVDAVLRRRSRAAAGLDMEDLAPPPVSPAVGPRADRVGDRVAASPAPSAPPPMPEPVTRPNLPTPSPMIYAYTDPSRASVSSSGDPTVATPALPAAPSTPSTPAGSNGNGHGSTIALTAGGGQVEPRPSELANPGPSDTTIVLPLSFKPNRQRDRVVPDEDNKQR
jgi:capsular polysaccharide biosynthesis protein